MQGVVIMTAKILLILLLTLLTGVCSRRPREIYVKAGEMVALYCPLGRGYNHGDVKVIWTSHTTQEMDLTNMSSAEQRQMGVLVHGRSLVILCASVNHRGNYSCSLGNASSQSWFRLIVCTTQSREYEKMTRYSTTCYTQEACKLYCPDVNVPAENITTITSNGIIWYMEGESLPVDSYFPSVEENDNGVYTCTRSYLHYGQIYNMTFTMVLDVRPKKKSGQSVILSPSKSDEFHVDLGSTVVIDCKAVMYSDFDEVFWVSGESFVETNNSLPVFYNYTRENNAGEIKMTSSLVFKKVSEEDLTKIYTCTLESVFGHSSSVTIELAQKASPSSFSLALSIVAVVVVVIVVTVVVYVKLKMDIALFLRDTLCCHRRSSDGKSYDAFLMCYKSDTDAALHEDDREWLESVLEERFGYSLCLYDRDVLPGKAVAEAVLDCIEQSRTVVLVPTCPDPGPGTGLLSAIHAALVERQTRLVFIKTETTEVSRSGSLPEALQLLGEAGDCVTWKGISSRPLSSSFWKQLRYYLPAPQHAPTMRLLPQTATQDDNC